MKKVFIVLAFVVYSVSSFATEIIPFSFYISKLSESKKLVLNLENMSAHTVKCDIMDQEGKIIYTDKINTKTQKARRYDLTSLTPGIYTISIDDLMKVEELTIVVTSNDVIVNRNNSEITYKPVVWLNENKSADFNLLSLGKSVNVTIYNENNEEVYAETFSKQTSIGKVYDFKKSEKGTYTMAVSVNGKTFYKYLTI